MPEMTGIQRLRELASRLSEPTRNYYEFLIGSELATIAGQIEAEQEERITRRVEDRDAAEWVRKRGGLEHVRAHWEGRVAVSHVEHMADKQRERRERMQRHIEYIQGLCRERRERIKELNKTVAEMRPRLMPEGMEWPRFEDGEPVRIGDDFEDLGQVAGIKFGAGGVTIEGTAGNSDLFITSDERVKRPAPKVLDADGEEIRAGDHVWNEVGTPFAVIAVNGKNKSFKAVRHYDRQECCGLNPAAFSHRAPVLAADGRPLREGETVWGTGREQHEYVVLGQPGLGGGTGRFKVTCHDVTDDFDCYCDPDQLTHERPGIKCRDCAHWQKDPTADNMGVCWFYYHEYEGQDCYAARRADVGACEEFMPCGKALAERDR